MRFRRLYLGGFLSSLVLLVPIVHMIPHAVRAGSAPRDAVGLISILGIGSLAGRLVLGHAADRLGRQRILGVLHVALGMLFLTWTVRVGFVTMALFAFAYGVCYGATIALRPAVIADHFAGPDVAAVTGLHYTSSVLGPLVGPAAFGYSVDFGNSDLIASCVAAACLIAPAISSQQNRLKFDYVEWPLAGLSGALQKYEVLSVSGLWRCRSPDNKRKAPALSTQKRLALGCRGCSYSPCHHGTVCSSGTARGSPSSASPVAEAA